MSKIWYGKIWSNEGTTYKRFVSMTQKETNTAIKTLKETVWKDSTDLMSNVYCHKTVKQEGNYMFLNSTQARVLGVDKVGYNVAIHIKGQMTKYTKYRELIILYTFLI